MYKIILADGKEIVINSLIYIIEKEFAKICSIASAKTGRTAIELAENFRPDIAVIDIHLPGINGLEVIREIKKNNHNVKFIALSADEKFDSLKKALRLGVLDYITKPLDRSQFTQALAAAMIQIDGLRKKRSADLNTKEKMSYILPLIEKGLIYHLLLQEYFEPDIIHYRNLLGFQQEYGYMINIIYEEKEPGNNNARVIERKIPLAQYYQEICILIKGSFNGLIGSLMVHTIPVLIPYSNSQMTSDEQIELIEKAQTLVRKLQQNVNTRFRIGIGSIQSWHHQLESFHDSLQALRHSTDRVAYTELSSLAKPNNTAILKDRLFEKTFDSSVHTITKQSIKNSDLIVQALDYINSRYHKELSLEHISRKINISPYYFSRLFKEQTGKNFVEYLTHIRIERAKELLTKSNYSMKEICIMVGYSDPNYFSRSFKKTIGITPTEYKERISKHIILCE